MKFKKAYLIIWILISLISCKSNKVRWEAGYLVPLVKTSLNINDIVNDSLLKKESDNSVSLVYRQNVETINFNNLVQIPPISFSKTSNLANLSLTNNTFKANITLGMISQNLPLWGSIIISQNGTNIVLPDITGITSGPHPISIQDNFSEATFTEGFMDITLRNDYPADVANLDYKIENAGSGTTFIIHSFPFVAAGSTESTSIDLAGKTVEGSLNAFLLNMDFLVGNQFVFIDTSEALDITITFRDLVIESATAKFPAQEVINDQVETRLELEDTKLKKVLLDGGDVTIDVVSTAKDSIFFNFQIPGATKSGVSFNTSPIIPPASPGNNVSVSFNYDFSGYELDLSGPLGSGSNILYSELVGNIDSTGQFVTLSENDSIRISLSVENLTPSYVEGFLGSLDYSIGPEDIDFEIFRNIVSGGISLENVSTYFTIENSVGVKGGLDINELSAYNSASSSSIDLISSDLSSPISINKAVDNPLTPSITNFLLDNENSNITDLINILPNKLSYELTLTVNEGIDSNTTDFKDFAYLNSGITSAIDMEMPLSLIADNLTLRDTIDLSEETLIEFEDVESADLNFIVDNGFPLSTVFELYFVDDQDNIKVSLLSDEKVEAAPLSNGRVLNSLRSVLIFPMTSSDIENMGVCSKLLMVAKFNSEEADYVKIYSDYNLRTTLSGDFIYKIND